MAKIDGWLQKNMIRVGFLLVCIVFNLLLVEDNLYAGRKKNKNVEKKKIKTLKEEILEAGENVCRMDEESEKKKEEDFKNFLEKCNKKNRQKGLNNVGDEEAFSKIDWGEGRSREGKDIEIKIGENDIIISPLPLNLDDITDSFDEKLIKNNTRSYKLKSVKKINVIDRIDFINFDFACFPLYVMNFVKNNGNRFYDVNVNLFNIFWGIMLTSGIDGGFCYVKSGSDISRVCFFNLSLGLKYFKNGYFRTFIGATRFKRNGAYCWPMWFGVIPINAHFDIVNICKKIKLCVNIELIFKRLISIDVSKCNCSEKVTNGVIPFIGDVSSPNIFETFFDFRVWLGFSYEPERLYV